MDRSLKGFACALFIALVAAWGQVTPAKAAEPAFQYFSTKLNVSDIDKSMAFYGGLMGMTEAGRNAGGVLEVLMTKTGPKNGPNEQALVLVYQKERKEPLNIGNGFNNITFVVTNIGAIIKKLEAAGYKVNGSAARRPSPTPLAKEIAVAFTKDPDGYSIELLERFN